MTGQVFYELSVIVFRAIGNFALLGFWSILVFRFGRSLGRQEATVQAAVDDPDFQRRVREMEVRLRRGRFQ